MSVDLMLDLLLACLLSATVVYCFVLNRRLSRLRNAQGDMAEMVRSFHQATEAARSSVAELKVAADAIGQDLQSRLQQGRDLMDEMDVVVSSASRLADRIEKGVESARPARETPQAPQNAASAGKSEAERELLQALREVR
jgi:hypothetical protein